MTDRPHRGLARTGYQCCVCGRPIFPGDPRKGVPVRSAYPGAAVIRWAHRHCAEGVF